MLPGGTIRKVSQQSLLAQADLLDDPVREAVSVPNLVLIEQAAKQSIYDKNYIGYLARKEGRMGLTPVSKGLPVRIRGVRPILRTIDTTGAV